MSGRVMWRCEPSCDGEIFEKDYCEHAYPTMGLRSRISTTDESLSEEKRYYIYMMSKSTTTEEDKKEYKQRIINVHSQMGLLPDGRKKPRTCWQYVKNNTCDCGGMFYHPEEEERLYLRRK